MFNFSLESVLNHRRLVEENIQKELALLQMSLVDERNILRTYEKTRKKLVGEFQCKQKERTTINNALLYLPFIDRVSMDIDKQKKTVLEFEEKVEKKRLELVEASKKKKTMEKLKEKALNTYKQGLIKTEQDFLNEVGVIKSNRKLRQER
jgi:flagellar FliJ protein